MKRLILLLTVLALAVPAAMAGTYSDTQHYTLGVCPVSGEALPDEPVVKEIDGREVKFCCGGCAGKYEADPATYGAKLDALIVEQQKDDYPMTTCVISGHELGGMGEVVDYVYQNRLVRFCCAGCVGKFEEDAKGNIEKIDAATIEQKGKDYPVTNCVVMPEDELPDDAMDMVIANRLIRLCCKSCVKDVMKDPAKWLGELDKAYDGEDKAAESK